ncbi:hypothetical protein LIER_43450 [Lithospermum erythrorhizon]|uniref:Uncharacterized protein n=1 Tax=Lithospermum erythrorhizon TaxID=34254 RepID=A0AAV3Q328_LITER
MGNCFHETLVSILKCLGIESSSSTSNYVALYTDFGDGTTSGNDHTAPLDDQPPASDQVYYTGNFVEEPVSSVDDQPTNDQELESEDLRKPPKQGVTTGSPQTNADEL